MKWPKLNFFKKLSLSKYLGPCRRTKEFKVRGPRGRILRGRKCSRLKSNIKIVMIEKWTDAFLIRMGIFTAVHSDNTQDLLNTGMILEYWQDGRQYDEQFRLKWQWPIKVIDSSRFRAVYYIYGHSSSIPWLYGGNKCFAFNFQGIYIRIPWSYAHVCIQCGHEHSVLDWPMSAETRRHM